MRASRRDDSRTRRLGAPGAGGVALLVASLLAMSPHATLAAQDKQPPPVAAVPAAPASAAADVTRIAIVLARELRDLPPPLSLLDLPPPDDGVGGARLAISDNNTTGRFLKQEFTLDVVESEKPADLIAEVAKKVDAGVGFVIVDAAPQTILSLADAIKDRNAVIFNASSADEALREENCRANVKHTIPSRAMYADALAQYLAWKRWSRWFLVTGPTAEDKLLADAYRRAAKRFGARIVEEREYKYEPGSRRTDGGHEQIQSQMPTFTQNAKEHDVVVVADEGGLFAEYLPYRTWDARPVVGSAGLSPVTWHPAIEQWGGTQFHNRFRRMNNRAFRELDYTVWMAVRSIGEAATRKKTGDAKTLIDYIRSPDFELAAFKGQKLTYRDWNGQLRQPILLATGKLHVSVSPQQGFLHQHSELDTLGIDRPESRCKL